MRHLETLAPCHSKDDAESVRERFATLEVFTSVTEPDERTAILSRTLSIQGNIPSLYTFFEDIKYLEPCAKIVRALYDKGSKYTIYQNLMGSFLDPPQPLIGYSRLNLRHCSYISPIVYKELAYVQIWLFAFRYFPELSNTTPRKSPCRDKPVALEPSPALWQAFGELAVTLGFKTEHACKLQQSDPTTQMASRLLQHSNSGENDPIVVDQIAAILRAARKRPGTPAELAFSTSKPLEKTQRCGRPYEDDHYDDRARLYAPQMLEEPSACGENVSTFYRKWHMLRTFFNFQNVRLDSMDEVNADTA